LISTRRRFDRSVLHRQYPAFTSDKSAAIKGVSHIVLTHGHSDHVGDSSHCQEHGATVPPITISASG